MHIVTGEEQHRRMLHTPIPKLVASLAAPTVATQLVSIAYNTADTYFVSQLSTSASAAVGVVFSLMSIIHALGFGIGMGCNSIISRSLGSRDQGRADTIASSGFLLAFFVGLLITAVGLSVTAPLMRLLGSTDTILPYALDYARIILAAAPFMCAAFVLNNTLRAEGEASLAMIGLCTGAVLNIGLDPLLIFTFRMGIAGAALATALSQLVSFLILLVIFLRGRSIVKLSARCISRSFRDYWSILSTGFPTICRQSFASLSTALLNNAAGVYGDAAVSAVTISNKAYMIVRSVILGIGQGFQPIAGYNYGAGDRRRTRQAFTFSVLAGSVICTVCAVLGARFAPQVVGFFRSDPEVVAIGRTALLGAAAVMPFLAYSTYVNQLYQCLGFRLPAAILASCRQGICFVPLILLLPRMLGLNGVVLSQPGADLLTFLVSVPFQIWFFRNKLRDDPRPPAAP